MSLTVSAGFGSHAASITAAVPVSTAHEEGSSPVANATKASTNSSNVPEQGTCPGSPGNGAAGLTIGQWVGEVADDEITCNAALNNVTRDCCKKVKGHAKLGSVCDLWVCKAKNTTESDIKTCFTNYNVLGECRTPTIRSAPAPATSQKSQATRRAAVTIAVALLSGSVLAITTF